MEDQNIRPRLRNPKACEQCKVKKARCNPSEVEGKCQKCLKAGTRCVPSERHPRPRRVERVSKTSGRVSELEKKLDGLLGSIESRNTPVPANTMRSPYPAKSSADPENGAEVLIDIHKHVFPDGIRADEQSDGELESTQYLSPEVNTSMLTPASSTSNQNLSQTTTQTFLDGKESEKLLSCFQEMLPYFPFIIIPPETNEKSMSQEKPFLFLAMITAASFTYQPRLQTTLDAQFRAALSSEVIIGGRKSLEIIQGLLVYLAWYPFHLNPRNAQTFQFLQIVISMCNDLGLDRSPQNSRELSHEHRRAYLGCYYLSTSFSTMFKKPNNILYTEYTKSCCDTFTTTPEYPTDTLLPWLVNLCHSTALFAKSPLTTTIPLEAFKTYLDFDTFSSTSTHSPSHPKTKELITLFLNFIPLFQTSLLGPTTTIPSWSQADIPMQIPLETIISNLQPCLNYCTQYLDILLSLSAESYRSFTIVQWSQAICAIATLSTISFPLPKLPINRQSISKDIWDSDLARREGRLGVYLESLCWRMSRLGGKRRESKDRGSLQEQGQNQFLLMSIVLEFVKSSFDRRIEKLKSAPQYPHTQDQASSPKQSDSLDPPGTISGLSEGRPEPNNLGRPTHNLSQGPTRCPMLNGTFRALATEASSTFAASSSSESHAADMNIAATLSNANPYTSISLQTETAEGDGLSDYNFTNLDQWDSSFDDFSLWGSIDWTLGDERRGD